MNRIYTVTIKTDDISVILASFSNKEDALNLISVMELLPKSYRPYDLEIEESLFNPTYDEVAYFIFNNLELPKEENKEELESIKKRLGKKNKEYLLKY
jgi:hypothetical protein